jgi:hypothetical protein
VPGLDTIREVASTVLGFDAVSDSKLADVLAFGALLVVFKLEIVADKAKIQDFGVRVILKHVGFSGNILIEQVVDIIAQLTRKRLEEAMTLVGRRRQRRWRWLRGHVGRIQLVSVVRRSIAGFPRDSGCDCDQLMSSLALVARAQLVTEVTRGGTAAFHLHSSDCNR